MASGPPAADPDPTVEVVRRLRAAGATPEEIAAAADLQALVDLSGEVALRPPGPPRSLREVAAEAGIDVERAAQLVAVAGLRSDDVDEPVWFASDATWMREVDAAVGLFDDEAVLALLRRAGWAMSQLAHAASAAFRVNVVASSPTTVAIAAVERNLATPALVQVYVDTFVQIFRHHLRTTVRDESVAAGVHGELRSMTVGFVDLAASTELGQSVTAVELSRLIGDFEAAAHAAATRHGARVVKTIGDEVMLAADEPGPVCRAALDLVDACDVHPGLGVARGGVCAGELLDQDGDCYGPVVNRAARFVAAATDGWVMVDETVAAALADETVAAALGEGLVTTAVPPIAHRGIGEVAWSRVQTSA